MSASIKNLDTTKCNLVGFNWQFPCGVATINENTVANGQEVDGEKLKRVRVQWFPKKELGQCVTLRNRVTRKLRAIGFSYLGNYIVHDDVLPEAERILAEGLDEITQIIDGLKSNYSELCNEWWNLPENADVKHLMMSYSSTLQQFSDAFKIVNMPTIKFGSDDQEALSKSLNDALYEDVASQARNCLRGMMDNKTGNAKTKMVTIKGQRDLLETLRKLSAHAPELAVATDTFSRILQALPVNNLEAHHISTLVLWNGVLADTYKLKEHIENIDTCDMSQFGLSMTYSPKASSAKPSQPKLEVNPQGFLDL